MATTPTKVDKNHVRTSMPTREPGAHKWAVGSVLIVAGSPSFPGAALLASRAAGRAGAGIVILATSRSVIASIASGIPEVVFVPLPETETSSGARRAVELIVDKASRGKSVVIGPGLGDDAASASLLGQLFELAGHGAAPGGSIGFGVASPAAAEIAVSAFGPLFDADGPTVVIDADALRWLATQDDWWEHVPSGRLVLTPHPGEMSKLIDASVEEIAKDPVQTAQAAASKWNQTVVLKRGLTVLSNGQTTLIADRESPALATAGSGDVLAGTIGGLIAQGMNGFEAAGLAMYLGPRAADLAAHRFGQSGVIATDLPDAYAEEMRLLRD